MHAELEAVVCNGPLRGRQHTYALLEERVPEARRPAREEALAELAIRYFSSHGPAQLQDFAWWSGLTLRDVREGTDLAAGPQLRSEIFDGKTYWSGASTAKPGSRSPSAHLLPNYDEYFIALRDRSAFFNPTRATVGTAPEGVFDRHIVVANGDIVGGWRSTRERGQVTIGTRIVGQLDEAEEQALASAAERYGRFLGITAMVQAD
jgi:Winged helix DNA-binding domain